MAHLAVDPAPLSPPEAYRLVNASVSPRPIAFVSTLSPEGEPNLAPFSYFMAGGANPPTVCFSPLGNRTGAKKDTLHNIEATGEYTISVVTFEIRAAMNQASFEYPYGTSEWEKAGFTPHASEVVGPAWVAESPLAMECKLLQIVTVGPGPLSANYIIGEIVRFWVDERVVDAAGQIDATKVDFIGRMSGDWYARAHGEALFPLARPTAAKTT